MTAVERRDIDKQYNKMSVDSLKKIAAGFDWGNYFGAIEVQIDTLIVLQPLFFEKIEDR